MKGNESKISAETRQLIRHLTKAGQERRVRTGQSVTKPPLGYVRASKGEGLWLDPIVALLVRQAFELVAEGWSLRRAHVEMTRRGLRSQTGRPLFLTTFVYVVHNPFYCGQLRFGGQLHPGSHQPIVSPALFERVQQRLTARRPAR